MVLARPIVRPIARLGMTVLLPVLTGSHALPPAREVPIVGTDYAFGGVPVTLPAGPASFSFDNRGQVRHMLSLVRLKVGITPDSAVHLQGRARDAVMEGGEGVLIALPHEAAVDRLLVDLVPGHAYLLYCIFHDAPDKPSHEALGMFGGFQVQ
jgi:hypothetical protein